MTRHKTKKMMNLINIRLLRDDGEDIQVNDSEQNDVYGDRFIVG